MSDLHNAILDLEYLHDGIPVISKRAAGLYIECCIYCMNDQGHDTGVKASVNVAGQDGICTIKWDRTDLKALRFRYGGNEQKTTENGATAVALMAVKEYTEYTAVREAFKGSTVDYMLCKQDCDEDTYIFECVDAYCEIRGIRRESKSNKVKDAVRRKLSRFAKAIGINKDLPMYVAVVEFGNPHARIVER